MALIVCRFIQVACDLDKSTYGNQLSMYRCPKWWQWKWLIQEHTLDMLNGHLSALKRALYNAILHIVFNLINWFVTMQLQIETSLSLINNVYGTDAKVLEQGMRRRKQLFIIQHCMNTNCRTICVHSLVTCVHSVH